MRRWRRRRGGGTPAPIPAPPTPEPEAPADPEPPAEPERDPAAERWLADRAEPLHVAAAPEPQGAESWRREPATTFRPRLGERAPLPPSPTSRRALPWILAVVVVLVAAGGAVAASGVFDHDTSGAQVRPKAPAPAAGSAHGSQQRGSGQPAPHRRRHAD